MSCEHHINFNVTGEYFEDDDPATREKGDMMSSVAVFQDPDRSKTVSSDITRPVSCISWGNGSTGNMFKEDCV